MRLIGGENWVKSLHAEYKRKTKILMWTGFIMFHLMAVIASLISNAPLFFVLFFVFCLGGLFLFVNGCVSYAELKGYSRWWGILGLVATPLVALLVILFLPDRPDKYEIFIRDVISDKAIKQWEEGH